MGMKIELMPVWLTIPDANRYSGLGKSTLEKLVARELVDSRKVVLPGNRTGRRLISRLSLDSFIEREGKPAA